MKIEQNLRKSSFSAGARQTWLRSLLKLRAGRRRRKVAATRPEARHRLPQDYSQNIREPSHIDWSPKTCIVIFQEKGPRSLKKDPFSHNFVVRYIKNRVSHLRIPLVAIVKSEGIMFLRKNVTFNDFCVKSMS